MHRLTSWIVAGTLAAGLLSDASSALAGDDPPPTVVHTRTVQVEPAVPLTATAEALAALDEAFSSGDARKARGLAQELLKEAAGRPGATKKAYDATTSQIVVMWALQAADAESVTLKRMNVNPRDDASFDLDLPGVGTDDQSEVYEVLLSTHPSSALITDYASAPTDNPLSAQFVDVVGRIVGPLFGLASDVQGKSGRTFTAAAPTTKANLWATSFRVRLPFKRAAIAATSKASLPLTEARATALVTNLAADLLLKDTSYSLWARSFAREMVDAAGRAIKMCTTPASSALPSPAVCKQFFDDQFQAAHKACIDNNGCAPPSGAKPTDADLAAVNRINAAFREFAANGAAESSTLQSSFHNEPFTHLAFGLLTGMMVGSPSPNRARVKVKDDGTFAADPVGRQISMIILNISCGYKASSPSLSRSERWRGFVGGVVTPDFGLGGGLSLLLVRGVAVNVGGGVLFSRGLPDKKTVGDVADPVKPFALARMPFGFVGASFNFK